MRHSMRPPQLSELIQDGCLYSFMGMKCKDYLVPDQNGTGNEIFGNDKYLLSLYHVSGA